MISLLTKVSLFCVVVGAIIGIAAIMSKKKKLLNRYFIFIVLSIILALIVAFMYPSYLSSALSLYKAATIITGIRDIIIVVIWFRYFIVSSRAKTYFGEIEPLVATQVSESATTEVE